MIGMTLNNEDKRTEALYRRLGVPVHGDIGVHFIWLPLLERIVDQLERVDILNNVTRDYPFEEK